MRPKKYLGQNFLINETILPQIIEAADISKDDTIIEVGPGFGILTEALLKTGAKVFAIEKDFDLIAGLTQKFGNHKNIKIVHQDALFFDETMIGHPSTSLSSRALEPRLGAGYKVVSNLPFNVASPLIRKFLESSNPPELMIVMIQKEAAEKILAKPGDSERGVLTLSIEFYADAEKVAIVSKNNFRPQPKVDAEIIKIKPIPHLPGEEKAVESKLFFRIVKAGFASKRRQVHNSLAATLRMPKDEVLNILKKAQIDPILRAEDLSLEDWIKLTKIFK